MSTLNTSQEGGAIQRSYKAIIDAPAPSGAAVNSDTYGQWALFSVSAPLASAFQQSNKDSVLKVQGSGGMLLFEGFHSGSSTWLTRILLEGELIDLIEDFNDGRIQFAFLRVKDTNSKLPKNVLIGWVR